MTHHDVIAALRSLHDPAKAAFFPKFFKTGPGQYGEGDVFLGITMPQVRSVVKTYNELPLTEARRAFLAPKLAAVLAQFRQIDAIDIMDVEPAPQIPERWNRNERK